MNLSEYSNMKAAKQASVLESQLETLKSEVLRVNRLATSISEMISSPKSCAPPCDKSAINTISDSLADIHGIAEEARQELEGVAKLIESQLGSLKLEY